MTASPAVKASPQVAINDIGSEEELLAAIDATIKHFNDGDIVEGIIVKVDRDEVLLDIGYKTEGVIPSRELSIKHDVDPSEVVSVGDAVEALVLQKEDKEGRLILSKKRAQYERAWGTIEKIKEEDGVVTGTVIEVVKGGLILDIGLRGFLSVASKGVKARIPAGRSGRLELAEWLTDRENPLTARVFVNRVWMHLFGEGLVRTVDDFGAQGTPPSHPELLDELALRFVEDGWSIKALVRSMVLSRAYAVSASDEANARTDPENRLFGRAHRRRLQAEVIRDAMLTVAGRLDRGMGGSSVAGLGDYASNNNAKSAPLADDTPRRSLYLPVIRNDLPGVFEVFDFADPDVATGRRDTTTVPTQALYLMNSPFVMEQARRAARRLLAAAPTSDGRLRLLYRLALGRLPNSAESRTALRFLRENAGEDAWAAVCQAMFGCTEFRFVE